MASYRMYASSKSINGNRVAFRVGGIVLGQLKAIEHRFSKLEIKGATGTIPAVSENHSSRTNGYGVWWMFEKSYDNTTYTPIKAFDGIVANNRRGGSTEREVWEKLDNTNLFIHAQASKSLYFEIDFQQYYNDSYTELNYVPGWINDSQKYFIDLDYELKAPTISDFTVASDGKIDSDVTVTWESDVQDSYVLSVNGKSVSTTSGTTEKSCVVPKNLLKIGENTFCLTVRNTIPDGIGGFQGQYITSTTPIKVINLSTLTPTVSNVILQNDGWLVDNPTTVSWQSTNQTHYKIYSNDKLVASGDATKNATIQPYTIKRGSNKIKVEIIKAGISGVSDTEKIVYHEVVKEFGQILPSIANLTVTGRNRDYHIALSWDAANYEGTYIYSNNKLIATRDTEKSYLIPPGTLLSGRNEIKVEVEKYNMTTDESLLVEATLVIDVVQDNPFIYSIEPSNINVNIEIGNQISFVTNEFCDRWEMFLDGVKRWQGTTERNISTGRNTFIKGVNRLTLATYYTPSWSTAELRRATNEVTFVGYGKPNLPGLDATSVYNTATPTFMWSTLIGDSENQIAYEIQVLQGSEVIEHKTINSTTCIHEMAIPLANNTEYTIMVSIKNKYNLWSDFAAKKFTTSFNTLPKPKLSLTIDRSEVLVTINANRPENFSEIKLYREVDNIWTEIADRCDITDQILDNTIPSKKEVKYKARLFDTSGGYSESDVHSTRVELNGYILTSMVNNEARKINLNDVSLTPVSSEVLKIFAGSSKPKVYGDGVSYYIGSGNVSIKNEDAENLISYLKSNKIFCYRDYRGKKLYCFIKISRNDYERTHQVLSLSLTEIQFSETRMYKGTLPEPILRTVIFNV